VPYHGGETSLKKGRLYIGTSGWSYPNWVGPFYPEGTSSGNFLEYYLEYFNSVEVNSSFYRLPTTPAVERWDRMAPAHFLFSVKVSRFITHMKKLKDSSESIDRFINTIRPLHRHLGPLLLQLPQNFGLNLKRLGTFLSELPEGFRYVFEFREPSWFREDVFTLLERAGAGFCIYDFDERRSPEKITSDFAYFRLHGPLRRYEGSYSEEQLKEWAFFVNDISRSGRDCFLYFDNDQSGHAPMDALRIKGILKEMDQY